MVKRGVVSLCVSQGRIRTTQLIAGNYLFTTQDLPAAVPLQRSRRVEQIKQ